MFGSDDELSSQIPTQVQSVVEGSGSVLVSEYKPVPDVDYLQVWSGLITLRLGILYYNYMYRIGTAMRFKNIFACLIILLGYLLPTDNLLGYCLSNHLPFGI